MRYKIKDIPAEGLVVSQAIEASMVAEALADTGAELGRTAGAVDFELNRSGDDVLVRGRVKATMGVACARCLAAMQVTVEQPIKMVYVREGGEPERDEEDPLDEEDFSHHDGNFVDVAEVIREQLILGVPISPHCSPGCRGLCPTCGHNLNEGSCGHEVKDSFQLSALSVQLKKLKNKADS